METEVKKPEPKNERGNLMMDAETLQELRVYAAVNNVTMAEVAKKAILQYIR